MEHLIYQMFGKVLSTGNIKINKEVLALRRGLTVGDKDAKQCPQQEQHPEITSTLDHDLVGSGNLTLLRFFWSSKHGSHP